MSRLKSVYLRLDVCACVCVCVCAYLVLVVGLSRAVTSGYSRQLLAFALNVYAHGV